MTPFCDFLSVTSPASYLDDLRRSLQPIVDAAGCDITRDEHGDGVTFGLPNGTIALRTKFRVAMCSASGAALAHLRALNLYGDYLRVLASVPHRVTRIDCTVETPVAAPPVVARIAARAREGFIALSRKAVKPESVVTYLSQDARGELTGTLYLGLPSAEVRGVVYDKRHERESKMFPDPGPLLRYEIRVKGNFNPTLRDAYEPAALFYHFAAPDLLPRPASVQDWSPHAEGFTLEKQNDFTAAQLMARKLDASADVARLIQLAIDCGPGGLPLLLSRITKLYDAARLAPPGGPQGHEAASAVPSGGFH